jgi:murein L,D-transpeptidase YafK
VVEGLFAAARVPFPPSALLFRAFKKERELEVWASPSGDAPMTLVATYEVCGLSGDLGPKRREGDRQVPEGFYRIHYLWPNSNYHLEMKIGYPNDLDRHLSDQIHEAPGGDIMIHGTCASIGCLAMSDERVEELWVMASSFQIGDRRVHVHIFPTRDIPALLRDAGYERHHHFWENLQEGYLRFERDHRLFTTSADWHAKYIYR